jgi:hypothetical protein
MLLEVNLACLANAALSPRFALFEHLLLHCMIIYHLSEIVLSPMSWVNMNALRSSSFFSLYLLSGLIIAVSVFKVLKYWILKVLKI